MKYYIVRIIKSDTYHMDFEPVTFFYNNETTKIIKLSTVGYNIDVRYNLKK